MTRHLLQDMITWLNMFSLKNGISSNLILAAITLGSHNPDYNNLNIKLRAYVQVYICNNYSTKQRKLVEIALSPGKTGRILFFVPSHWETAPRLHMDGTTHRWSSKKEGEQPGQ